jgi:TPR repeat protein
MNISHISLRLILFCAIAGWVAAASIPQEPNIAALHKQAKEGNAEAQFELAKAYLSGTGVAKDSKQGVEWLRKAAALDHPGAELALAILYMNGGAQYVPKDPKQGLEWLRKSAAQDYGPAEFNLGTLYRRGDEATGIPKKPHQAANWFRKAARQQGANSQTSLQEMLQERLISKQEANWKASEPASQPPEPVVQAKAEKSKAFSLAEIEKGLQGGITCKRMATLVDTYKVDFTLTAATRDRLSKEGADENLLTTISASKHSS